MHIEGATALVTGGVSGLGLGASRMLLDAGASVAMIDIDEDKGGSALVELGDLGEQARFIRCDVSNPDQVEAAVAGTVEELGRIRILVNAAGVAPAQRLVSRDGTLFDLGLFTFTIGVNLIGMFDVIRNVAGVMAGNDPDGNGERGVIVNVASIAAFEGQVGQAAYSASKGGVVGMTLPLARDLGSLGVRVMTVAPGIMDTPSSRRGSPGAAGVARRVTGVPAASGHTRGLRPPGAGDRGEPDAQRRGGQTRRRGPYAAQVGVTAVRSPRGSPGFPGW